MPSSTSSSKAFVTAFLGTVAIALVGFLVGSELLVRHLVAPNHNLSRYLELFRETEAETVVFGDSEIAYGFAGVEGFVNLGMGGDRFPAIARKVELFLETKAPKRLVLQAGLHHFSSQNEIWHQGADDAFEALLKNPEGPALGILHPVYRRELPAYWLHFLGGRDFRPQRAFRADGGRLTDTDYSLKPEAVRARAAVMEVELWTPRSTPDASPIAAEYRRILDRIQGAGVEACLVTMPLARDLAATVAGSESLGSVRRYFNELAQSRGLRYVDLLHAGPGDDHFEDASHLNATGALEISARIAEACFGPTTRGRT